jgi:hypothetical protein
VVFPQAKASIEIAAEAHVGERPPRVIELTEKTVKYETQALIDGKVSAGELEAHIRRDARNESRRLWRRRSRDPGGLTRRRSL